MKNRLLGVLALAFVTVVGSGCFVGPPAVVYRQPVYVQPPPPGYPGPGPVVVEEYYAPTVIVPAPGIIIGPRWGPRGHGGYRR